MGTGKCTPLSIMDFGAKGIRGANDLVDWLPCEAFAVKRVSLTPSSENHSALSWAGGFGVMGHGVRVGIRVNDESLIPKLLKHLPEIAKPLTSDSLVGRKFDCVLSVIRDSDQRGDPEHSLHLIHHKLEHSVQARHEEDFLDVFNSRVGWAIACFAPRRVFVHAGAVAWQGRAIIIPGASLSGKSTLVAELVRAGATYLSDEFAVLDSRRPGLPLPKGNRLASNAGLHEAGQCACGGLWWQSGQTVRTSETYCPDGLRGGCPLAAEGTVSGTWRAWIAVE